MQIFNLENLKEIFSNISGDKIEEIVKENPDKVLSELVDFVFVMMSKPKA